MYRYLIPLVLHPKLSFPQQRESIFATSLKWFPAQIRYFAGMTVLVLLAACSGGGDNGAGAGGCSGSCTATTSAPTITDSLTITDVQKIISQAVLEATTRNAKATIAVVDRVGNVLAVFRMTGAAIKFKISSGRSVSGGLENIDTLPDSFAAISKAITAAYLSSEGNAFSTRTAGQIIQENFNPREFSQPSGPLFGVQFSQLSCSDLTTKIDTTRGPHRSPLGLSADPGGLPLYKDGRLVGAVGVIADATYGIDLDITDIDSDTDELIAVAGTQSFAAPVDRRADRITADGRTFRFTDSESIASNPAQIAAFGQLSGALVGVSGYTDGTIKNGVAYDSAASGMRLDAAVFSSVNGMVLVDTNNTNRYAPKNGTDGLLTSNEVTTTLTEALKIANRARAQIRRPLGSAAQVTVTVVDTNGEVLGLVRTVDAPVFGIDVALQKARTAMFFSQASAGAELSALPSVNYIGAGGLAITPNVSLANTVSGFKTFMSDPTALANGVAYSNRAIGNLARPLFPDGIASNEAGPLGKPYANWSVFNNGMQLDLVYNALIASAGGSDATGCTGNTKLKNGIQIFPGAVPIYRGAKLVGAIGVSGDGVDQDDMIAFLGLANAGKILNTGVSNAPASIRADNLVPRGEGTRLRYVQCPQAPFNDSSEQNVCTGL